VKRACFGALGVAILVACSSRTHKDSRQGDASVGTTGALASSAATRGSASADPSAAPTKPGMLWVPSGTLRAGTPAEKVPRVPDEELAGVPIEMQGFYIDQHPWPNEPGAIPTTNVTRDEAEALCTSKGKRLCTELEWERACKGPENTTYEYGDAYRSATCGTGQAPEVAARRPAGESTQCKSGFGVSDMHGIVSEWTSSSWGRGAKDPSLGVLRGGNATVGELAGRCANGLARAPSKKSPTMGLRCCAGPKNAAEVKLALEGAPGVSMAGSDATAPWASELATVVASAIDPKTLRGQKWVPLANEELFVVQGCGTATPRQCGLLVGRVRNGKRYVAANAVVGRELGEVSKGSDAKHLRLRALDLKGTFSKDIAYVYGKVEVGELKRP
jgi:formylglycine-generating enzyme